MIDKQSKFHAHCSKANQAALLADENQTRHEMSTRHEAFDDLFSKFIATLVTKHWYHSQAIYDVLARNIHTYTIYANVMKCVQALGPIYLSIFVIILLSQFHGG